MSTLALTPFQAIVARPLVAHGAVTYSLHRYGLDALEILAGARSLAIGDITARSFANYAPPVFEALGLAEIEPNAKNNRMRGKQT